MMKRLGAWIFTVVALVILAPTVYFVYLGVTDPIRRDPGYDLSAYEIGNFPMAPHPQAGRMNTPGIAIRRTLDNAASATIPREFFDFNVFHDGAGGRVDAPTKEKPGDVDFAACGESSSWGFGLQNEKTYVSVIEDTLDLKGINVSSIGATPLQCYFLLKDTLAFKPGILVFFFWEEFYTSVVSRCVNTHSPVCVPNPHLVPKEDGGFNLALPANSARDLDLFRRYDPETSGGPPSTLMTDIFWHFYTWKSEFLEQFEDTPRVALPQSAPHAEVKIAAMNHVLAMLDKLAKDAGAELLVAYIPFWGAHVSYVASMPGGTTAYLKSHGMNYVDLSDDFNAMIRANIPFRFSDGHLNEFGHATVATKIAATPVFQKLRH